MRPEIENATDVIPQRILSCVNVFSSRSARISNKRQEASSEPVANASPFGKNLNRIREQGALIFAQQNFTYCTALMSDSWPVNVCVARPLRISQSFAVASQAPETKTFWLGPSDRLNRTHQQGWKEWNLDIWYIPHHITSVVTEFDYAHPRFNVPKHAGHIS